MHKSIMQRSGNWILVILVTAVLAGSAALLPLRAEDEGFRSLVPEQDISELWVPEVTPAESWSLKDGVIISTGKPTGYLRSKKKYRNYLLNVDWRYKAEGAPPDANSGIFLSISGPPQRLPKCIETQMQQLTAGSVFGLSGAKITGAKRLKGKARPIGEWNHYEITVQDGNLSLVFNGEKVNEGTGMDPADGHIGLQSEGWEVHFRNISIKELP